MKMVRAIIRPEIADKVADSLESGGFLALTRMEVFGRGKQKGIKVGDVIYDNLPKIMMKMSFDLWGAVKQLDWAVFAVKI